jgi:hypothetical protein
MDRQSLAGLIPLAAICIALAEYLWDKTEPRYTSPTFWLALFATIGMLVLVQVLRFGGKSSRKPPSKPDYSARAIIRRTNPIDRGNE